MATIYIKKNSFETSIDRWEKEYSYKNDLKSIKVVGNIRHTKYDFINHAKELLNLEDKDNFHQHIIGIFWKIAVNTL